MKVVSKVFLLAVLLCIVLAVAACSSRQNGAARPATAGQAAVSGQPDSGQTGTQPDSTTGKVKPGNTSGLSAKALVFTYNADCCESTRQFFDQHRNSVKELENKYGNRVQFTWYDVAVKDEVYQKEVLEAANKAGVQNIPAFVVLDAKGNVLTRQIGQLKMDEVSKVFEGLNR